MDNLNDDRRLVLNAKISGKCVKIYVNMYHYLYLLWLILERMEIDIRRSHLDNLCKIIFKYKIITYNNFPSFITDCWQKQVPAIIHVGIY